MAIERRTSHYAGPAAGAGAGYETDVQRENGVDWERGRERAVFEAPGPVTVEAGGRAGLMAGLVAAIVGLTLSFAMGAGFWTPFKLLAASILGVDALIGGFGTVLLGGILHFAVAAFWGIVFAALVRRDTPQGRALAGGLLFGVCVWAVMTFIGLPVLNRTMVPRVAMSPAVWFITHLVYGACLMRAPELKWRYADPDELSPRRSHRRSAADIYVEQGVAVRR